MFRWIIDLLFGCSNKDIKCVAKNNYKINDDGDITIKVQKDAWLCGTESTKDISIKKSFIVSHTENSIVFQSYKHCLNSATRYIYDNDDYHSSIENKEDLIEYKDIENHTYKYSEKDKCWKRIKIDVVGTEAVFSKTPLVVFLEEFNSKYKLIETVDEFNDYLSSSLDCNTWCRKKLYNKMKELGLGDGFINQFADLVGNDLDKYYAMIDLANEVSDKDTLMYLYTYKFRQN